MEVILLLSRDKVHDFFMKDSNAELMYALIILLKRARVLRLIESSWLGLDSSSILSRLKRAELSSDLIVVLRLLSFIRFDVSEDFCSQMQQL